VARTRVLIVDDHEFFRQCLRSLLESRAEWEICGEASDGLEAVEAAKKLRPDIVLMDVSMQYVNGLEATKQICKELPKTRVLIVSQHDSPHMTSAAADAGAFAYVTKSQLANDLFTVLDAASKQPVSRDGLFRDQ